MTHYSHTFSKMTLAVLEIRKGLIMVFVISVKHNNNDIFGVRMWFVAC